jgi:tetratricopeptide (TPR) repeat protein
MRWAQTLTVATLVGAAACTAAPPPALPTTPAYPDVPALVVPPSVTASSDALARHDAAWRRLQSDDLRGAARDFAAALDRAPGFYPAQAGLGYVALLERRFDDAGRWFGEALAIDATYVPALSGRVEAALSADDGVAAIRALEQWITVAPDGEQQDDLRARLDVLRLRGVQAELASAATARRAGRFDDAQAALERARVMTPGSGVVLRELARVEIARGAFDAAEAAIREAVEADAGDPESHAVLGEVLEAEGRFRDASAAYARAVRLDPRREWTERVEALTRRADLAGLPAEYRAIPSASTLSRGQLAALLGIRLQDPLERAPQRAAVVLTDINGHWASPWIVAVTRAGLMEAMPNHTFQPAGLVTRADLARAVWRAIQVFGTARASDLEEWRATRPTIADVPRTHLAYDAVAAAVASGALGMGDNGRFGPNRLVTGAEAGAALARLEQIVGRRR